MNHSELRQHFYHALTHHYSQGEMQSMYHWMVAEIHGWSRIEAYTHGSEPVQESDVDRWKNAILRLQAKEPLQYIFQAAFFCDLKLEVNPFVLIPRPETEELVELVLREERGERVNVLDVGTGSGCIPIALKMARPDWTILAIDNSQDALNVAKRNATRHGVEIDFRMHDAAQLPSLAFKPDIIVSNPPYIPIERRNELETNVLAYEPHQALFAPEGDAFYFYRLIADYAQKVQAHTVYVEIHADDAEELRVHLSAYWIGSIRLHKDMQGKNRFMVLTR